MMPINTKIPSLPTNDSKNIKMHNYLNDAIKYIEKYWSDNLQPLYIKEEKKSLSPESILFPITHTTAEKWLISFCKNRLSSFGKYEDAIDAIPRNILFHSAITPMLNIGLLTPEQVVETVTEYYKKHNNVGIANYEGFIRQIIGWREYQRYIYKYAGEKMRGSNYFNNNGKLSNVWYNATTNIKPVDDAIRMAINDGYIHHILRLMVMGNIMNLIGIHPDEVYKWFMEFSLDSYDWVMVGNVYSMALWADGGLTMRKPYISSSAYILKMGNFDKTNLKTKKLSINNPETNDNLPWTTKWDILFHYFINRNSELLNKTYYAGLVKAWNRKNKTDREKEIHTANIILSQLIQ
jgi:deoxyribodipyrimidine photolyase-related protein